DLAFDPNGNLYFTDPKDSSKDAPIGRVYRVDKLKNVTLVAQGLAFTNGIAFSADGRTLYVAESQKSVVLKYPVNADGSLGAKSVFCTLPGGKEPDGMNFDAAGNLWVAEAFAGAVREFDPSGKLMRSIDLPGKQVTHGEFGATDMKTLYSKEAETGTLKDWVATGDAFDKQPIKGDTVAPRRSDMKSDHRGQYWIGTFEIAGDKPKGTLSSVPFKVTKPYASFLVGGGPNNETR